MTAIDTKASAPAITRLAHWIVLSWGWRRALVAIAAGACSALAMAPLDAWPVLFFTFPVLVWLTDGAAGGRFGGVLGAAAAGWWFGFGYHLVGLYWVGYAFLVDAKTLRPQRIPPFMLAVFDTVAALGATGARRFLTTGRPGLQNGLVCTFWGAPVVFESASLREAASVA